MEKRMTNKEMNFYRRLTNKKYPLSTLKKCARCGATNMLRRHHPQGLKNWSIIEILCTSCHAETHKTINISEWKSSLVEVENSELNEFREWIRKYHLDIWRNFWEWKKNQ